MRASPLSRIQDASAEEHMSEHHHVGRYEPEMLDLDEDCGTDRRGDDAEDGVTTPQTAHSHMDEEDARSEQSVVVRLDLRPIDSPFRTHSWTRNTGNLFGPRPMEQSPSLTSIGSLDLADILLPTDDPLLDSPSPSTSSTSSWESTMSSDDDPDSFQEGHIGHSNGDNDDAEDSDPFLNLDARFIDYGWGGECLREIEDIDFEFVYALHTFVATVEGQANATKGDTMVLLDDSNSYWWLVRVVKDSSIGEFEGRSLP